MSKVINKYERFISNEDEMEVYNDRCFFIWSNSYA